MNRIELYIDSNERLTIDFFLNHASDLRVGRYKGEECESLISALAQSKLMEVLKETGTDNLILKYYGTVVRINECSKVNSRKSMEPLKKDIKNYLEKTMVQKAKNQLKPRLELYIDSNEKLTLDLFLNGLRIERYKGQACYSLISEIAQSELMDVLERKENDDFSLVYEGAIVHINEYSRTNKKRGMGPLKKDIKNYLEKLAVQKLKNQLNSKVESEPELIIPTRTKPKVENVYQSKNQISPKVENVSQQKKKNEPKPKVVRKNKHAGKTIIAGVLALSILGGLAANEFKDNFIESKPTVSFSEEFIVKEDKIEKMDIEMTVDDEPVVNLLSDKKENSDTVNVFLNYQDRSNTEKARITKSYYGSTIEKYAKMYGLDPQIVLAIATQERGIHSTTKDSGGATGLMQIQNAVWSGEQLKAYNYNTNSYETIIVEEEKLSDVFYNIKVGCMYFQNCMEYMDGNVLAAIQCYNMGYGNMNKILASYSLETNRSIEDILSDITDYGWLNHRDIITVGDQEYVEHVFSWISDKIELKTGKNSTDLKVSNQINIKNMSYN